MNAYHRRAMEWLIAVTIPLIMLGCGGSVHSPAPADPSVVATQQGQVKGIVANGVREFLGLRYAAPPTGALRWKPPAPAAAYASSPYDASHVGSVCVQGTAAAPTGSEDCLFVNVYVPGTTAGTTALPVLFWIHGGGFILGSGAATDGSALALKANAIVVTINYRLNALGFLAHPALAAEDPNGATGDYGIMDQTAALAWVQKNIAAFGGDPTNVTIFGDSAGGHSVYVQLASPGSARLFAKAVAQSGGFSRQQESLQQAETDGVGYAKTWGCTDPSSAVCLRNLPASALLQGNPVAWYATIDGKVLPGSTSAAFASGQYNRVPVMSGFTEDEGTYFVAAAFDAQGKPVTASGYEAAIQGFLGVSGAATAALYPANQFSSPGQALAKATGDYLFTCGEMQDADNLAKYSPAVYMYRFSDPAPYSVHSLISVLPPTAMNYGAFHSSDLDYWWQLIPSPTANQATLSGAMTAALAGFAHTGNPNSGSTVASWPLYTPETRRTLDFGYPVSNTYDAYTAHQCSYWYGQAPSHGL
ncbi:carboxylesterase/lipase family protein [Paraburkholderia fungorum]|uniref:carboxylesterase/lipase family protein n=1 Tax=Paraburkholderia fungorum TaxID=134537 RepID=UPI00402B80AF